MDLILLSPEAIRTLIEAGLKTAPDHDYSPEPAPELWA